MSQAFLARWFAENRTNIPAFARHVLNPAWEAENDADLAKAFHRLSSLSRLREDGFGPDNWPPVNHGSFDRFDMSLVRAEREEASALCLQNLGDLREVYEDPVRSLFAVDPGADEVVSFPTHPLLWLPFLNPSLNWRFLPTEGGEPLSYCDIYFKLNPSAAFQFWDNEKALLRKIFFRQDDMIKRCLGGKTLQSKDLFPRDHLVSVHPELPSQIRWFRKNCEDYDEREECENHVAQRLGHGEYGVLVSHIIDALDAETQEEIELNLLAYLRTLREIKGLSVSTYLLLVQFAERVAGHRCDHPLGHILDVA